MSRLHKHWLYAENIQDNDAPVTARAFRELASLSKDRIAELETALRDCIPFLAVQMNQHRRDFGRPDLHPKHAEILDRCSRLTGGDVLSAKLADSKDATNV